MIEGCLKVYSGPGKKTGVSTVVSFKTSAKEPPQKRNLLFIVGFFFLTLIFFQSLGFFSKGVSTENQFHQPAQLEAKSQKVLETQNAVIFLCA